MSNGKYLKKFVNKSVKNGKDILIIAGVHGNELTPIFCAATLARKFEINMYSVFKSLKTSVIDDISSITIVNAINYESVLNNTREIPNDNISDLNRMLKHSVESDMVEELKSLIVTSDIVIDIHSSPSCTEFVLIDIDKHTDCVTQWCKGAGKLNLVYRYSGADTIKRYCLEAGIMAVTLELNGMNLIDIASANKGVKMVLSLLENARNAIVYERHVEDIGVLEAIDIKTSVEGMLSAYLSNGEEFSKGSTIATICDLSLNVLANIKAPCDGYIVCQPDKSYFKRGDYVCYIQPITRTNDR